jgi:F420-dependent oxidoreductase-like protein
MRLSANPGYWGAFATPQQELAFAVEAERLGFDAIWVGEPYGNDAATVLAWYAGATTRLRLGTAVLAIPGRTPAMTAQTAATLDALSGGRLLLGLGLSGPQVSEGWHGVRFDRPLARTRDYVEVVRLALRSERVRYDGPTLQLPLPDSAGKALKLILRPRRAEVPVYLAALGPQSVALCGEIADGWLPWFWCPEHADELAGPLRDGAARAGRHVPEADVAPQVVVRVDEDADAARDAVRDVVALYVGGMGSKEQNFYHRLVSSYGFEAEAVEVQELYLSGRKAEAEARLSDELIGAVCLVGSPARVADRLQAYAKAGATTLVGIPWGSSAEDRLAQLRLLAEAGERSGVVTGQGSS